MGAGRRVGITVGRALLALVATTAALASCAADDDGSRPLDPLSTTTLVPPTPTPTPTPAPMPVPSSAAPGGVVLPPGEDTVVEAHTDGDTIRTAGGVRVRLIGINTPETRDPRRPVECFGREASAHMAQLLPVGTPVRLEYDVERADRYDRVLAYVHRASDGLFVNAAMVRDGYAEVATYPPNVRYVDTFVALQREARDAQRGLWQACGSVGVPA